jgi:putative flippase GtrA
MKKRRKKGYDRTRQSKRQPKSGRIRPQQANCQPEPSRDRTKLIARFIGVGLLNTVVGYAIYGILILSSVPYLAALLMATMVGVIFNYFSIGRLVFKSQGGRVIFIKFIAAYCMVYATNAMALDVLIKHLQFDPYIGQAICVPLSVILSWLFMNYWVYKTGLI